MKILIVDNTLEQECWGSEPIRRFARAAASATLTVRRAPHEDLPRSPHGFDRIIISGSGTSCLKDAPWIEKLHQFIRQSVDANVPTLGVCYGHQSLVRALGGKDLVRRSQLSEHGWTQIEVLGDTPLLSGLPKTFYSFSAHYEEVSALPRGMRHLAKSRDCNIQACQLEDRPIYGIQFHPEKDPSDAARAFSERKKEGPARGILQADKTDKFYNPKIGEMIFSNFLKATS